MTLQTSRMGQQCRGRHSVTIGIGRLPTKPPFPTRLTIRFELANGGRPSRVEPPATFRTRPKRSLTFPASRRNTAETLLPSAATQSPARKTVEQIECRQQYCRMTTSFLPAATPRRALYQGGPEVSSIAWGMWRFGGHEVAAAEARVSAALDAGVILFDTADIYGPDNNEPFGAAETLLGRVLAHNRSLVKRMVIATKGGIVMGVPYDSSGAYLRSAIDASLTRLGIDQVALWQIHRPDSLTHPAETARALEDAHRAGKIGAIGVSNFTASQTAALQAHSALPIVSCQQEFSPLEIAPLTDGVVDFALARSLTVLAWSPLGGGRLASPKDDRAKAVAQALDNIARAYDVSRAAAAYSWIMAHPARPIPIVGTQTSSRIAEIPDAYKPRWTRSDWYQVLVASRGERLP